MGGVCVCVCVTYTHTSFLKIYLFLERGERREKEKEISVCEKTSIINQLSLTRPQQGTWPTTQAHALSGNQTGNLSSQAEAQPTEPHWPGLETCL